MSFWADHWATHKDCYYHRELCLVCWATEVFDILTLRLQLKIQGVEAVRGPGPFPPIEADEDEMLLEART